MNCRLHFKRKWRVAKQALSGMWQCVCKSCSLKILFGFRARLKTAMRDVGGTTETFDNFFAVGGVGGIQMRAHHEAAEASGIAGLQARAR
jgi:O-acetylhomoserine/O-acetylserine sulfhydrylase-like pyridoxal-dependent enzyme